MCICLYYFYRSEIITSSQLSYSTKWKSVVAILLLQLFNPTRLSQSININRLQTATGCAWVKFHKYVTGTRFPETKHLLRSLSRSWRSLIWSKMPRHFIQSEGSLPCTQKVASGPQPEQLYSGLLAYEAVYLGSGQEPQELRFNTTTIPVLIMTYVGYVWLPWIFNVEKMCITNFNTPYNTKMRRMQTNLLHVWQLDKTQTNCMYTTSAFIPTANRKRYGWQAFSVDWCVINYYVLFFFVGNMFPLAL